jgi:hypothetical protein
MVSVPIVEELSENRSDGRAEHRLSEVFRSDMSGKCIKNTLVFGCKKIGRKEALGSIAYFWLLML